MMVDAVAASALLLLLVLLGWAALRRHRRAARADAWFLGIRRYVLRGYARRRDGRTYDPARNPEVARLGALSSRSAGTPMDLLLPHVDSPSARTRRCLARARGQRGLPRLYALALTSLMLREQLDGVDRRLQALFQGEAEAAREDPAPALADIAALASDLGERGGEHPS